MSTDKDNDLDDLFKKGLADPGEHHTGYREADWEEMAQLLDRPKKHGIKIYWLPLLGSVAALMLLFVGWWEISGHYHINNGASIVKASLKKDTGISGGAIRQPQHKKNTAAGIITGGHNGQSMVVNHARPVLKVFAVGSRRTDTGSVDQYVTSNNLNPVKQELVLADPYSNLTAVNQAAGIPFPDYLPASLPASTLAAPAVSPGYNVPGDKIKITTTSSYRPAYAISVLGAPDVNGVGSSFTQGKVGTNVGLMFAAGISRKFTISTGALYSVKPYATAFNNYHTLYQFATNPVNVMADCRMIDIPLNLNYQVYHHQQNKISIGTGLSSYLMLHESYNFTYANNGSAGPLSYGVRSPDKYFFGVMNINATYEHQLNSKVGINLQPYVKLPLTNIGYSQVKLQTTGVAVGLTWNLNPLTKP